MIKPKYLFFDAPTVIRAVDKATRQVLSKFGAYVRTTAMQSIRSHSKVAKRGKFAGQSVSLPGQPPFNQTGILRDSIFFSYDLYHQSVVIGPVPFRGIHTGAEALEYGGYSTIKDYHSHERTVYIKARPFMSPALQKELPKLPAMWAASVTP
jgi:phage gpG-like protein